MSNALCDHIPFLNVNHYTIIPLFIIFYSILRRGQQLCRLVLGPLIESIDLHRDKLF